MSPETIEREKPTSDERVVYRYIESFGDSFRTIVDDNNRHRHFYSFRLRAPGFNYFGPDVSFQNRKDIGFRIETKTVAKTEPELRSVELERIEELLKVVNLNKDKKVTKRIIRLSVTDKGVEFITLPKDVSQADSIRSSILNHITQMEPEIFGKPVEVEPAKTMAAFIGYVGINKVTSEHDDEVANERPKKIKKDKPKPSPFRFDPDIKKRVPEQQRIEEAKAKGQGWY